MLTVIPQCVLHFEIVKHAGLHTDPLPPIALHGCQSQQLVLGPVPIPDLLPEWFAGGEQ